MPTLLDSNALRIALVAAVVLATGFALPAGCAPPPEPVAVVGLAVDRTRVRLGASVEVTIQFDVAPDIEPLNENYRVVLEMLDEQERTLWSAEHDPAVPTSAWRPRQSIRYTERLRIPPYPYIGPAALAVGLQSPISGARLPLAGNEVDEFAYRAATLTLDSPHESSFVSHESGWHQVEFNVFDRSEWRWTTGRAVLSFRNPYQAVRLQLTVQGRPDLFERPQLLSLVVGERTLADVTLDRNEPIHFDYELAATALGEDDVIRLELLVDRTFAPADSDGNSADTRELGVRVFDAYIEPLAESNP